MRDRLIFSTCAIGFFGIGYLPTWRFTLAIEVSVLIFTALLASMQSSPFRASTVAFPGYGDVWGMTEARTTFAPHVHTRANLDYISSSSLDCSQTLSPSAVKLVAGVDSKQGDSPLCPRSTTSLTIRADYNDQRHRLRGWIYSWRASFRRRCERGKTLLFSSTFYNYRCLRASATWILSARALITPHYTLCTLCRGGVRMKNTPLFILNTREKSRRACCSDVSRKRQNTFTSES